MFKSISVFGAAMLAATCVCATAAGAATFSVNCASAKIQTAIDAAPAGTPNTISVSGACLENLTVPYGKQFKMVGATGSSLKPKNASLPAIVNNGWLTLHKMNVQSSGSGASLIQTTFGRTEITASTLNAPNVSDLLDTSNSASLSITNSSITGGTSTAISLVSGAHAVIVSDAARPFATSPTTTISTGKTSADAIWCGPTAGFRVRALPGSPDGIVKITNSMNGISANGCTAEIQNKTSLADNITISGMSNSGVAVANSRMSFRGVRIMSNTKHGIALTASHLLLTASKIYSSGVNDIWAIGTSEALFNWGPAPNSLPDVNKAPYDSLSCAGNSEISIPVANLVQNIGTNYAATGCVKTY